MVTLGRLFLALFLAGPVLGCGDSGNRVVDVSTANVPSRSPAEAQKEAESDLPKP
jgi:hypothetical protein